MNHPSPVLAGLGQELMQELLLLLLTHQQEEHARPIPGSLNAD